MPSLRSSTPSTGSRLTFNADWTVTQSGPLISGQPIEIEYAPARMLGMVPRPRMEDERHSWNVTGYYRVDNGPVASFCAASDSAVARARLDPQVDQAGAGALEVWFEINDLFGMNRYDSDYGRNFKFKVFPRVLLSSANAKDYAGSFGSAGTGATAGA